MKQTKLYISILLMTFSSLSYAGLDGGGGGNIEKAETLVPISTEIISNEKEKRLDNWFNRLPDTFFGKNGVNIRILDLNDENQIIKLSKGYAHINISDGQKIKIENNNQTRIQVILSIDGIDPFTRQRANVGTDGIIVMPGNSKYFSYDKISTQKDSGEINIAVFFEKENYPVIYPHMQTPPNNPENFVISESGERVWIPPKNYPFRKKSNNFTPDIRFHFNYSAGK